MPELHPSLTASLVTEKNKVSNTNPWIWLVEVNTDGSNAVRIAAYDAQVTFESTTWYPFPIQVGRTKSTSGGTVDSIEITVSNAGRIAMQQLEDGNIIGNQLRLLLVNSNQLAAATNKVEWKCLVQAAIATEDAVTLTCGVTNPMSVPFPGERMWRTRCRFLKGYGSGRCGYDTTLTDLVSASINTDFDGTTCDGTLGSETSGNGCKAHGRNERENGAAEDHPRVFGGFPGIPKGTVLA